MAFGVDAREGANRLDYGRGGHVGYAFGLINDVAQGEAKVAVADGEEVQGVRVAVNGAAVDVVCGGDGPRAQPIDELLFDGVSLRMAADGAAGFVGGNADWCWGGDASGGAAARARSGGGSAAGRRTERFAGSLAGFAGGDFAGGAIGLFGVWRGRAWGEFVARWL